MTTPLQFDAAEDEGPLAGKRVVFAGKLGGMNRREAHQLVQPTSHIAKLLGNVDPGHATPEAMRHVTGRPTDSTGR